MAISVALKRCVCTQRHALEADLFRVDLRASTHLAKHKHGRRRETSIALAGGAGEA